MRCTIFIWLIIVYRLVIDQYSHRFRCRLRGGLLCRCHKRHQQWFLITFCINRVVFVVVDGLVVIDVCRLPHVLTHKHIMRINRGWINWVVNVSATTAIRSETETLDKLALANLANTQRRACTARPASEIQMKQLCMPRYSWVRYLFVSAVRYSDCSEQACACLIFDTPTPAEFSVEKIRLINIFYRCEQQPADIVAVSMRLSFHIKEFPLFFLCHWYPVRTDFLPFVRTRIDYYYVMEANEQSRAGDRIRLTRLLHKLRAIVHNQ